ncbi:MAG: iron ABC transporter permease [Candidatus Krumholzibacteriota bacterium]|nr:iron ABC transporter permease [Candidatus Krumholzibacteriota bacterium]
MKNRRRWFLTILLACPALVALGLFLGEGWRHPLSLFDPERRGILAVRGWRVALGALVGASLSVAGAVLQAVLRNPLAEPYVLGLSSGAGLGAALCIVAGGLALGSVGLPAAAFAGGLVSLLVVHRLARVGRSTAPHTLILAGVIWSALCGSLLMFIVSQSTAQGLHAVLWWFLGDLQVFDVPLLWVVLVINGLAFVGISYLARDLNALMLGEEMAGHVGLDPERARFLLLTLASALTAASVCVSGLIAFVGLTVPHAARALVGADHRRLLPAAACAGAAFLVIADGLGRMLFFPLEVPVGVITAFVGGPFFLALLRRRQHAIWT